MFSRPEQCDLDSFFCDLWCVHWRGEILGEFFIQQRAFVLSSKSLTELCSCSCSASLWCTAPHLCALVTHQPLTCRHDAQIAEALLLALTDDYFCLMCLLSVLLTDCTQHSVAPAEPGWTIHQHTAARVSLGWTERRGLPDRRFSRTETLILSYPPVMENLLHWSVVLTVVAFHPPPLRVLDSGHLLWGHLVLQAGQTLTGVCCLCSDTCVNITRGFPPRRSGCGAEKVEDVCLAADSA